MILQDRAYILAEFIEACLVFDGSLLGSATGTECSVGRGSGGVRAWFPNNAINPFAALQSSGPAGGCLALDSFSSGKKRRSFQSSRAMLEIGAVFRVCKWRPLEPALRTQLCCREVNARLT